MRCLAPKELIDAGRGCAPAGFDYPLFAEHLRQCRTCARHWGRIQQDRHVSRSEWYLIRHLDRSTDDTNTFVALHASDHVLRCPACSQMAAAVARSGQPWTLPALDASRELVQVLRSTRAPRRDGAGDVPLLMSKVRHGAHAAEADTISATLLDERGRVVVERGAVARRAVKLKTALVSENGDVRIELGIDQPFVAARAAVSTPERGLVLIPQVPRKKSNDSEVSFLATTDVRGRAGLIPAACIAVWLTVEV